MFTNCEILKITRNQVKKKAYKTEILLNRSNYNKGSLQIKWKQFIKTKLNKTTLTLHSLSLFLT